MKKSLVIVMFSALLVLIMYAEIEPPGSPSETESYTLEDIYNRVKNGTTASKSTFAEPVSGPGQTGHSLNDIYDAADEALSKTPVPKTGQTTSYATGDDGDLQKGVALPSPRFTDNYDGSVTDNLTGLVWLKNASADSPKTWADAVVFCNDLESGSYGLADGSLAGDWRLPNVRELQSLLDYSNISPVLPSGHPFSNLQSNVYWTSTTFVGQELYAWGVNLDSGVVEINYKTQSYPILAVRDGD